LKIWITPFASVAMLEKLALLKMALCRAPAFTIDSSVCPGVVSPEDGASEFSALVSAGGMAMAAS